MTQGPGLGDNHLTYRARAVGSFNRDVADMGGRRSLNLSGPDVAQLPGAQGLG
jgi:hypothetical protein